MTGEAFGRHLRGSGRDDIRHACPDHTINDVPPLCPWCYGLGTVDEATLARYVRTKNAEAKQP